MMDELFFILPLLIIAGGSLAVLMIDVFMKGRSASGLLALLILFGGLGAALLVSPEYRSQEVAFNGTIFIDPFTSFISVIIIAGAILCLLMGREYLPGEGVTEARGEFASLYLMTTAGALLFVSAAEMVTLFVGLELMSMALYVLCGSALRDSASSESALKYFFLGSFSSAFLLLGIAFIYGATGTLSLVQIAATLPEAPTGLIAIGVGLILMGVLFKIGAVPLHFWTPDVYQGAPTPVTVFMASVIKVAGVCVGLRLFWLSFGSGEYYELWARAVWFVAVLTIVVGNLVALRQRSVKRMLAYSSVAHAGYMLMGLLAPAEFGGGPAILFYLVAYSVMTLGAFGVVMAVSSRYRDSADSDDITRFHQLSRQRPLLAALMTLFMLSLAGLPPGMAGLLGKFYVFNAAVKADFIGLAIVGVLGSAISCSYYLRVIVAMYFIPSEASESESGEAIVTAPLAGTLAVCGVLTVWLGLQPSLLYDIVSAVF
ncbi:MAG: NADH-quinone oxidoreductase subunit N [Bdellovibrionota bacterium]|jgi:NADH-quinone oxidoreductase subunit N